MTKETKQKLTTVLGVVAVLIAITALIFWGLKNIDKSASSDSKSLLASNTKTSKSIPIKLDLPASVKQNQSAQTYTATQNPDQSTDITLASQDFFKLNLPQNLNQPVSVLLSNSRTIALSQQGENNLQAVEKTQIKTTPENEKLLAIIQKDPSLKIYQNENQTTFYTAQESKNENQQWLLKNWTLYSAPPSQEAQPALGGLASNSEITQAFKIQNATVNLDSAGNANVFFGDKQAKNQNPDFVIPRPYLLDKNAVRKDLDWKFEKTTNLLSVTFAMPKESFPIALDPSILKTDKVVATFSGKKISMHAPVCGDVGYTVTDIDSNVYNAVLIGTQCWLKENMMTTKYPDGTSINCGTNACLGTNTWSGADNGYYAYPPNIGNTAEESLANIQTNKLGFVYQWSAVMKGSITPGAQGICPTGWHVPTHDEYTTLERAVCTSGTCVTDFPYDISTMGWRGINEGSKLSQYTSGGTNSSGFSGILAGNRNTFGSFSNRTSLAFFWSSSPIGGTAWYRYLSSGYASVYRLQFQGGRFFCSLPEELILRSRIVFDSFVFHSTLNFEALA